MDGAQIATVSAASIAALAAMATLGVNVETAYRKERREAHRKSLEPMLYDIQDALHEVIATSRTQHNRLVDGKASASWRDKGDKASKDLDRLRRRVRYQLPGLERGFYVLVRVPNWTAHRRGSQEGLHLLDLADELVQLLHDAVGSSWRTGKTPSRRQIDRIDQVVNEILALSPTGPRPAKDLFDIDDSVLSDADTDPAPIAAS